MNVCELINLKLSEALNHALQAHGGDMESALNHVNNHWVGIVEQIGGSFLSDEDSEPDPDEKRVLH